MISRQDLTFDATLAASLRNQFCRRRPLLAMAFALVWIAAGCAPTESQVSPSPPPTPDLTGRWHIQGLLCPGTGRTDGAVEVSRTGNLYVATLDDWNCPAPQHVLFLGEKVWEGSYTRDGTLAITRFTYYYDEQDDRVEISTAPDVINVLDEDHLQYEARTMTRVE